MLNNVLNTDNFFLPALLSFLHSMVIVCKAILHNPVCICVIILWMIEIFLKKRR